MIKKLSIITMILLLLFISISSCNAIDSNQDGNHVSTYKINKNIPEYKLSHDTDSFDDECRFYNAATKTYIMPVFDIFLGYISNPYY